MKNINLKKRKQHAYFLILFCVFQLGGRDETKIIAWEWLQAGKASIDVK